MRAKPARAKIPESYREAWPRRERVEGVAIGGGKIRTLAGRGDGTPGRGKTRDRPRVQTGRLIAGKENVPPELLAIATADLLRQGLEIVFFVHDPACLEEPHLHPCSCPDIGFDGFQLGAVGAGFKNGCGRDHLIATAVGLKKRLKRAPRIRTHVLRDR